VAVSNFPLTGGCLCGRVRYEVSEPLVYAGYCHCTRCQRRTGTGSSVSGRTVSGSLLILSGEELVKTYAPPDGFHKLFCTECGSALFSRHPQDSTVLYVRLGTFDADPGIRPSYRQYVAYAAPWEPIPDDGLERYPEARR
jgi:hypothetical protein